MNTLKRASISIIMNGLALYGLVLLLSEISYSGGFKLFLISGIVLGILNSLVKPVLKILTLPLIFLTGGLFLILINAIILWLLTYFLEIIQFRDVLLDFPSLGTYVIAALVFGVINWALHLIIKK